MSKRVLIVGAGGFVGGHLATEGLRRGYDVWAGVRESTSLEWLDDERLNFMVFDFDVISDLVEKLTEGPEWDYIIYNLGATKCLNFSNFNRINYEYLRNFTQALEKAGRKPGKLLFISSLSAMGPGDEKGYTPIKASDIPSPNTRYGASKLKAEMWLATAGIPAVILRPTGVYGPRDRDYYLMFESMTKGVDFGVGYRRQLLSFIYVEDLADAAYDALEKAPAGETYPIAEPRSYSQKEFRKIAAQALGKKHIIGVKLPLWIVKCVSTLAEKWGVLRMKPSTLNRDKFNIMKQRNWSVDISKAQEDFGFAPKTSLRDGVERTVAWYKKEGWLK